MIVKCTFIQNHFFKKNIGVILAKNWKRPIQIMSLIQILVCLNIDIGGAIVYIFFKKN